MRNAECGVRNERQIRPDYSHLQNRTKAFAVRVIKLVNALPSNEAARVVGRQLLKAGTSVGANYRASCRAKSRRDFIAKMGIVEEECDESIYWMEILIASDLIKQKQLAALMAEGSEILAIVVQSIKTARARA